MGAKKRLRVRRKKIGAIKIKVRTFMYDLLQKLLVALLVALIMYYVQSHFR